MIIIERTGVYNMENAARGARNAMNSWDKMDSQAGEGGNFVLGEADLELLTKLCRLGSSHRKFLRQIFVSADITAPLYWWKEYDTYKVGTTANSQSTMHKLHTRPISLKDFSHEKLVGRSLDAMNSLIDVCEDLRREYVATKNRDTWYALIQLLPSSYMQMRTCSMNYENLVGMMHDRKDHKLEEWRQFCGWIESLPYAKDFMVKNKDSQ